MLIGCLFTNDDNYKNILQVKLQKAFKVTPIYKEISEFDEEEGYHMGVYLCLGQTHYALSHEEATKFSDWGSFENILATETPKFIFLGSSKHKIKKKAEQEACRLALETIGINTFLTINYI